MSTNATDNADAVGVITGGFESDGSLDLDSNHSMQQEPAPTWPAEVTCERKYYSSLAAGALAALAV